MLEPTNPPIPEADYRKRLRPKTYAIAVYLVGLFIILQLLALGLAFWFRQQVIIEKEAPLLREEQVAVVAAMDPPPAAEMETEVGEPAKPSPEENVSAFDSGLPEGRLAVPAGGTVDQQVAQLNEDARLFRRQGDFSMAEVALKQALGLKPNDILSLTNYAMLEEARGNRRAAYERWKQVIATAPEGDTTVRLAMERSILLEEALRLEEEARQREEALLAGIERRVEIAEVRMSPDPLPEKPTEIQRDVVIKSANPGIPIDSSKLRVQVFVYDQVGGRKLEPAKIEARFLNSQPDFNRPEGEVLRTVYRAKLDEMGERAYYGYIVRIYYDNQLQDQRAEPRSLMELFSGR
jgi:tetratricopeptide (TPR) repeat protein